MDKRKIISGICKFYLNREGKYDSSNKEYYTKSEETLEWNIMLNSFKLQNHNIHSFIKEIYIEYLQSAKHFLGAGDTEMNKLQSIYAHEVCVYFSSPI